MKHFSLFILTMILCFSLFSQNLGIGIANPTDKLHVNGNIRVVDDADIFGLDQIVGFNDLRFYGDAVDGPDMLLSADGRFGIGTSSIASNVTLTVMQRGTDFPFLVRGNGNELFYRVEADGNAGYRQPFNNVSLNIRDNTSNIRIFNCEQNDGTNVFEVNSAGNVVVNGDFSVVNGTKNFRLDHPVDPANKTLTHAAVESPNPCYLLPRISSFGCKWICTSRTAKLF